MRIREYAPPDGGGVQCTVTAEDDILIGPVQQIEQYMRSHVSASTEGAFYRTWNKQTRGPQITDAVLTFARNGETRTVHLKRTVPQSPAVKYTPFRALPGGIGYINLFVLKSEAELADAFQKVRT
jgi:hypothetical protein